jgi:hypothetical protein
MIATMADGGPGMTHQVSASTRPSDLKRSWWNLLSLGLLTVVAGSFLSHPFVIPSSILGGRHGYGSSWF